MSRRDLSVIADVFGKHYGEVLLVSATDAGPEATVYTSFPLDDCPAGSEASVTRDDLANSYSLQADP